MNLLRVVDRFLTILIHQVVKQDENTKRKVSVWLENFKNKSWYYYQYSRLVLKSYKFRNTRTPLTEQEIIAESCKQALKYNINIKSQFEILSERRDFSILTRKKCEEFAKYSVTSLLYDGLVYTKMFDPQYLARINVAEKSDDKTLIGTFEYMEKDISERITRNRNLRMAAISPIFILIMILGFEVYIALQMLDQIILDDVNVTQSILLSYIRLKDLILYEKMRLAIYVALIILGITLVIKSWFGRLIGEMIILNIPYVSTLVKDWCIAAFFEGIIRMVNSGSTLQDAVKSSIDLIPIVIVRDSIRRDLGDIDRIVTISDPLRDNPYISYRDRIQLSLAENKKDLESALNSTIESANSRIEKVLESPIKVIVALSIIIVTTYLFTRLIPFYNAVNDYLLHIIR